jgi:hypothetical protein
MKQLIAALEGLFTAAVKSAGELAGTASFTLDNANWTGELNKHEPTSNPVVETHREAARPFRD